MSKVTKLLRELIALPSVNPALVPPKDPRAGERLVADFLAAQGAQAGLQVEFQKIVSERANVLITLAPRGRATQRVLLAPHLDTVPDAAPGQLQSSTKAGRIYGRGACDTKGSAAAMLTALIAAAHARNRPQNTEIVFAGLIDEEVNQAGSRALAASGFKADLAIVGEPTRCQAVTAHKGGLWLRLTTTGKAAHGACPELGINAVHAMARIVDVLETEYARLLGKRRHPLLGPPTVNVGSIQGGTQPNIVPDYCEISVDRRTIPGESEGMVRREIQALLRQHGLRAEIGDRKTVPCHPLETDPNLPLVRQFRQIAGSRRPVGVHFFCDAAILAAGGIPSVVFGPGDIAQAHTPNEWVAVSELEKATAILTRFLVALP
jgi:acetylornithine deacetylase/succinyl-diaminopimelate desuccinylase-like protein